MANALDETTDPVSSDRDVRVINKRITMETGAGSIVFEVILWVLAIIPGLIFTFMKIRAKNHLDRLEQRIQANASQIDNYLEQRVIVLQNAASLVNKAVEFDKDTFGEIAAFRGGVNPDGDVARNEKSQQIETVSRSLNMAFEAYPQLQGHQAIKDAMRQNEYYQREITAARDLYNDTVARWNTTINQWPTYKIVAAKNKLTTRIPFSTSDEIRTQAKANFFE